MNFILSDKLVTNIEKINDKHFMSDESSVSGKLWEAGNIKDQPACRNRLSVIILSALKNGTYLLTNLSESFSMTLILLVSLFIFLILPAIPLVPLHFIKWYLKHIIYAYYVLKGLWSIKYFCLHTIGLNACDRSSVSRQLHYQKTVCVLEQIMSMEKYLCIFLHQIEAIVYIYLLKCTPM